MTRTPLLLLAPLLLPALGCGPDRSSSAAGATDTATARADEPALETAADPPFAGAVRVDHLILPGETRFEELWQLTFSGENAEAYFSPDGKRLVYQRRSMDEVCDAIWVTPEGAGEHRRVSSGQGATTCAYFLPDGKRVLYASTHAASPDCPPKPDRSEGYVWALYPTYDIYVQDLAGGAPRRILGGEGYDAEATVSPKGGRLVFTSTRSGDLELWTANLEGGELFQVTDAVGYDGGAFFSHDGERLVFRSTAWTEGQEDAEQAAYRDLLGRWKVRPSRMEIHVVRTDGSERKQVTRLGGANWAPYFFPDDSRILFASNHHTLASGGRRFNLFAVDVDGGNLEQVTFEETFDSFPMFSPDGRWLVFGSNRGGKVQGETNLFLARWR